MFRKYPSIENHYQAKTVEVFLNEFPFLKDECMILHEKIHGANTQIIYHPNNRVDFASRRRILSGTGGRNDLYGFKGQFMKYEHYIMLMRKFMEHSISQNKIINVYGEWFGGSIQKGVDYGKEKRYRIFDAMIDGIMISPMDLEILLDQLDLLEYLVPTFGLVNGFEEALNTDVNMHSFLGEIDDVDNIMEGVVIKPYTKVLFNNGGKYCAFKRKNKGFEEKAREPKRIRVQRERDPKVEEMKAEFQRYITEMRVQGIYSKYGLIKEAKQIGEYMKYILEDAKEDFFKDGNIVSEFGTVDLRYIFNVSKIVVPMLNREINKK